MRALAILAATLVASAALSGCIGGLKETDGSVPPATGVGGEAVTPAGTQPPVKVLSALNASLTVDAPAWIQSGTEVPVALSAPANAKGNVTYSWAIGPRPGTVEVTPFKADTGSAKPADYIQPGASKSITYGRSGVYRMHCHPHPNMAHTVTVIEGYEGPKSVEVLIVDGASKAEQRYVPDNIVIGVNTTVNYKNVGSQAHSATAIAAQSPPLKALPLKAASGSVKVDGEGWQRIVATFTDSEGRVGVAEQNIYATATLPVFETQSFEFSFAYGSMGLPVAGTAAEPAAQSEPVTLAQGGLVTLNYTFEDALGPSGASPVEVEVHFTKDGETQDTITSTGATGTAPGKALPGAYTLTVVPVAGVEITGTVVVDVVYELVPPDPTMPSAAAAGEDPHAGH